MGMAMCGSECLSLCRRTVDVDDAAIFHPGNVCRTGLLMVRVQWEMIGSIVHHAIIGTWTWTLTVTMWGYETN